MLGTMLGRFQATGAGPPRQDFLDLFFLMLVVSLISNL